MVSGGFGVEGNMVGVCECVTVCLKGTYYAEHSRSPGGGGGAVDLPLLHQLIVSVIPRLYN